MISKKKFASQSVQVQRCKFKYGSVSMQVENAILCGGYACGVRDRLRRLRVSSVQNARLFRAQISGEIVRVECAKCRRECDLSGARVTLAEIVCVKCAKCRKEGVAICPVRMRPFAEIVGRYLVGNPRFGNLPIRNDSIIKPSVRYLCNTGVSLVSAIIGDIM